MKQTESFRYMSTTDQDRADMLQTLGLANVEELSLSGKRVRPHAHLWLTQWPEVAQDGGPEFRGSVL